MDRRTFDIGVVIALPEELNYFFRYIESIKTWKKPEIIPFWFKEFKFYRFELADEDKVVQVVVHLVGEMGPEHTALGTNMLLTNWNVLFLVNIGVTGSLDKDLKVGSILVPSQICHYSANSKARDGPDGNVEILMGTTLYATKKLVRIQFESFLATKEYQEWQHICSKDVKLPENNKDFAPPTLCVGHLASGNVVIDSENYKKEIKRLDRKIMGCEMETAGFLIAEQFMQSSAKVVSQFISLRCISDMAANKASAESGEHGILLESENRTIQSREWAMRNATILFLHLVKVGVINADIDQQIASLDSLNGKLKEHREQARKRGLQSDNRSIDKVIVPLKSWMT